jgi:hypothetical protein
MEMEETRGKLQLSSVSDNRKPLNGPVTQRGRLEKPRSAPA